MKKSRLPYLAVTLLGAASLVSAQANDLTWTGAANGNWNTSSANWSGSSTIFTNGDNVSFTDTGLTPNPVITLTTSATTVTNMTVSNTSGTYAINVGATGLTGTTLTKSGAGTLSFGQNNNSVTFASTNLQGGTLIIRQGSFNGGAINVSGNVSVNAFSTASTNLNGTSLTGSGELTLTPVGPGRIGLGTDLDTSGFAGTIKASASGQVNVIGSSMNLSNAKVVLSGDTLFQGLSSSNPLQIGQIDASSSNTLGNGVNSANLIYQIGALNTDSSIAGVIRNGGVNTGGNPSTGTVGLTKVGTGTLTLTGANTYTAVTTVNAGTLLLGDGTSGSLAATATTVNAGEFFGNLSSGDITAGVVTIGNNSVGTDAAFGAGKGVLGRFVSSNSLTLNSDAEFVFDLNSGTELTDTVTFGGVVALNGVFTLNDLNTGAINWSVNDSFTVVSGASRTGVFSNLADGATISVNGVDYQASYSATALTLTVTSVIPEPGTWALLAAGLAMTACKRRRPARA